MSSILDVIPGRARDLGDGFTVRRVLPIGHRKTVGPFIFFDHLGPVTLAAGQGMDVRPHPHIGLATVTYLFEGRIRHRDSLGMVQDVEPGAVNWMTAGRGIVHSERSRDDDRAQGQTLHGIQAEAECESAFVHHPADTLPAWTQGGASLRLIAGNAYGRCAPVDVRIPTFYLHLAWTEPGTLPLPDEHPERAVYVVAGKVRVDGMAVAAGDMAVLTSKAQSLHAETGTVAMLLGGAPVDGERQIWWNFVTADPARLEAAKRDWAEGRFPKVPGETEFIPLPKT
jgi:redox-sensitive bicupin YhaK (pirin superfamily)